MAIELRRTLMLKAAEFGKRPLQEDRQSRLDFMEMKEATWTTHSVHLPGFPITPREIRFPEFQCLTELIGGVDISKPENKDSIDGKYLYYKKEAQYATNTPTASSKYTALGMGRTVHLVEFDINTMRIAIWDANCQTHILEYCLGDRPLASLMSKIEMVTTVVNPTTTNITGIRFTPADNFPNILRKACDWDKLIKFEFINSGLFEFSNKTIMSTDGVNMTMLTDTYMLMTLRLISIPSVKLGRSIAAYGGASVDEEDEEESEEEEEIIPIPIHLTLANLINTSTIRSMNVGEWIEFTAQRVSPDVFTKTVVKVRIHCRNLQRVIMNSTTDDTAMYTPELVSGGKFSDYADCEIVPNSLDAELGVYVRITFKCPCPGFTGVINRANPVVIARLNLLNWTLELRGDDRILLCLVGVSRPQA